MSKTSDTTALIDLITFENSVPGVPNHEADESNHSIDKDFVTDVFGDPVDTKELVLMVAQ